jgi:hypothetical protein
LTGTGALFLYGTTSLAAIDLSEMPNLSAFGGYFLRSSAISSLDLSPLAGHVVGFGEYFLAECKNIVAMDISPVTLTYAMVGFMQDCSNLTQLNIGDNPASAFTAENGSNRVSTLAQTSYQGTPKVPAYVQGITVTGTDRDAFLAGFSEWYYSYRYRKLV